MVVYLTDEPKRTFGCFWGGPRRPRFARYASAPLRVTQPLNDNTLSRQRKKSKYIIRIDSESALPTCYRQRRLSPISLKRFRNLAYCKIRTKQNAINDLIVTFIDIYEPTSEHFVKQRTSIVIQQCFVSLASIECYHGLPRAQSRRY